MTISWYIYLNPSINIGEMNALAGSQMLCFCREILGASKNKYTNEKREIIDRLTLLCQQFCRKDVWRDTELTLEDAGMQHFAPGTHLWSSALHHRQAVDVPEIGERDAD